MRAIVIIALLAIAGVIGMVVTNSSSETAPPKPTGFSAIQADVNSGARLYDVRTSQEYSDGHFENADNWSLQDMQAGKLPKVAKGTKIYVYCRSGSRSSQAVSLLKNAGFTAVVDLGGLQDVQNSGGTLQQG